MLKKLYITLQNTINRQLYSNISSSTVTRICFKLPILIPVIINTNYYTHPINNSSLLECVTFYRQPSSNLSLYALLFMHLFVVKPETKLDKYDFLSNSHLLLYLRVIISIYRIFLILLVV